MGYLKDIQDMPNQYEYSQDFFKRFIAGVHNGLVLVGDVPSSGRWTSRKSFWRVEAWRLPAKIPVEPAQTEPRTAHVDCLRRLCNCCPSPFAVRLTPTRRKTTSVGSFGPVAFVKILSCTKAGAPRTKVDVLGPDFSNQLIRIVCGAGTSKDPKDV